jgi:hypothetical protein
MDNLTLRSADGYFQITRFNITFLRPNIFYCKSDDALQFLLPLGCYLILFIFLL